MRRHLVSKARTAFAVGAIVAVLAVMAFPDLSFGQTASIRGGSPSAVYMQKNPGFCSTVVPDGVNVMEQEVILDASSHVLVSFTFEWSGLDTREEGLLNFSVDGQGDNFDWGFLGNTQTKHTSGTVTWPFADVPAGQRTVIVGAWVDPIPGGELPGAGEPSAGLENCALTVFVIPE
jgi:hypothetical protein